MCTSDKKQTSKKTENVRDPISCMKMSDFNMSVHNSQIRMIFLMKPVLMPLFIHLRLIAIKFFSFFSKKISQISKDGLNFRSQPKTSGFLPKNVRDPRSQDPDFLSLCPLVQIQIFHKTSKQYI